MPSILRNVIPSISGGGSAFKVTNNANAEVGRMSILGTDFALTSPAAIAAVSSNAIDIFTGTSVDAQSGAVILFSGATSGNGTSGPVELNTGNANGTGASGGISSTTGNSSISTTGSFIFITGDAGTDSGSFIFMPGQFGGVSGRFVFQDCHMACPQGNTAISFTVNANAGAGATAASATGTDVAGRIIFTTGVAGRAPGPQFTLNFGVPYQSADVIVQITPGNNNAGANAPQFHVSSTGNGFTLAFVNTPAAGTQYIYNYQVIETQ